MNGWQTAAATVLCVVTGTVYDSQHHPAPSIKVYLQAIDKKELTVQTDSSGVYRFSVPRGTYTIRTKDGVSTIKVDANRTLDLTLQPAFFDEPKFTTAGVTDYTYRGGHGSDTVFRSSEALTKETAALTGSGDPRENELFSRGTDLLNHKEAQAAAEVFTKGVGLFPQSQRMLLGLAAACYAENDYDEAAQWFYKATDLTPNDPKPYLFLGQVKARQIIESDGYRERMARFAKLQPDNALANYYYGATLPDDEAHERLERAVTLDPHLAPAHVKLGIIAVHQRKYDEAIGDYRKAIEADPELGEAHYRLSEAYRLTGDPVKAKEELAIFQRLSH